MTTLKGTLTFHDYWHAGTGHAGDGDTDAAVAKDPDGLPILPGRTLKGLLREGCLQAEECGLVEAGTTTRLFGRPTVQNQPDASVPGTLSVSTATLEDSLAAALKRADSRHTKALYEPLASTAIDAEGLAKNHTLRLIEVTLPCTLEFKVTVKTDTDKSALATAAAFIRAAGAHRHRGLGRCTLKFA